MTQIFKLRKIGFRHGIGTDEVASILLYTDKKLAGYTNNTNWILEDIFPEDRKINNDYAEMFTLYIAEIYNVELRLIHYFSWKHVNHSKSWVFIPDTFKLLEEIEPPFLENENDGYTLLTQDDTTIELFKRALTWGNIGKKQFAPFHKGKTRKRGH